METEQDTLITHARVTGIERDRVYLRVDGTPSVQELEIDQYSSLKETAIGDCYELKVRLEGGHIPQNGKLEILAVEEMLHQGKHMKDVSSEELWGNLIDASSGLTEGQKAILKRIQT